jgi:dTDP-4-amino-4,6-dideoxygalactose transaminase
LEVIKSANLAFQVESLPDLLTDIQKLLLSGNYVSGSYVKKFEDEFAGVHNAGFGIGVNSGTSALHAALHVLGLRQGDEVIVPSHTFIASVISILLTGATPVLVDVNQNGLVNYDTVKKAVTKNTKAVMPVHLYGSAVSEVEMEKISELGIPIIEDCSQAHGATFDSGKRVGGFSEIAAFSLYPGKGLGGFGEGGICITNDGNMAQNLKRFRNWGTEKKYNHEEFGLNYRMDEIQALVLVKKLKFLGLWNQRRTEIAKQYRSGLKKIRIVNSTFGSPTYHQFVVAHSKRDSLQDYLLKNKVETLIHYPVPNHLQKSLRGKVKVPGSMGMTESLASEILSLPIYPGLQDSEIQYIIEMINNFEV